MRDSTRPVLLFYCQHSLGIGHLTRSFALATALAQVFRVVFLNGGRLPPGLPVPESIELINLPALGMDEEQKLVSRDDTRDVATAQTTRRACIEGAVREWQPAVLLVELFPFGRKKFVAEILQMIRLTRRQPGASALVACSLRDILVDARSDQQHYDDRAGWLADRYFDVVLVHSDPAFARLEDSFHPRRPMRTPVHYSGFVVPRRAIAKSGTRGAHLLVSAGGGIVGDALFRTVLQARKLMRAPPPMRFIAGPFLQPSEWEWLQRAASDDSGIQLQRHVPDMVAEMRTARASISQCGYNTALDIVVASVPALVVPYETKTENEQRRRAQRLAALGVLLELPDALDAVRLAARIDDLLAYTPRAAALALDGAEQSARILSELHLQRRQQDLLQTTERRHV